LGGVAALSCTPRVRHGGQRNDGGGSLARLAAEARTADYQGDLAGLRDVYRRIDTTAADPRMRRNAHYWRGFAMWRRAQNAANVALGPDSIVADLEAAAVEFRAAMAIDPGWVEASSGAAAVLMNIAYFRIADAPRARAVMREALGLLGAAQRADSTNPRVAFVAAGRTFWAPVESGGNRQRAIADLQRAIARLPDRRDRGGHPADPAWGEAELHMLLAFFYANLQPPERERARQSANAALVLQPDWHYVRNVLLPQIDTLPVSSTDRRPTVGKLP
jgi:hypothetical protein